MALTIGLTGGIGAGKSTAAAYFSDRGIPVVDADDISRRLTAPGALGSLAVGKTFGPDFLTPEQAMDRRKMRDHVFRDASALLKLEAVLHPLIAYHVEEKLSALQNVPLVIYDCPLLWKPALRPEGLSRILVIDASDAVRLTRISARPGIDTETARRMIAAQPARAAFLQLADDVIVNDGTPEALRMRLEALENAWLS